MLRNNQYPFKLAIASIAASGTCLLMSSYGFFVGYSVYESPSLFPWTKKYTVVREYNRDRQSVTIFHRKVEEISDTFTTQKIAYSVAGVLLGMSGVCLCMQLRDKKEINEYRKYLEDKKTKIDLDWDAALYNKIAQEKAALTAADCLNKLSTMEPFYQSLLDNEEHTEAGIEWVPPALETTREETKKQVIQRRLKAGEDFVSVVRDVLQIDPRTPEGKAALRRVVEDN